MTSYSLDVETFISEVKKYPEIWDLSSEDHRDKYRKQRAWAEVARVFIVDFDQMPDIEKNDVYRKLQGKWRNIRDSYARHVKRKYGKRGYLHAKHLAFLDEHYKQGSPSGSDVEVDADPNGGWHSDSDETKFKNLVFNVNGFETKTEPIWKDDEKSDKVKRKRKSNQLEVEFVDTPFQEPTCSYQAEDDDKSFFDSLLPAVRDFNVDQKLEFRSDVIRLIKNIRSNTNANGKHKLEPMPGYT